MTELSRSFRRMRKRPARSAAGVLALALGIASSTAAFSVVQAVLLEPLPVQEQDRLVVLWQRSPARGFDHVPFRPDGLDDVASSQGIFEGVAGFETAGARPALGQGPDGTFPVRHVRVAGDFFGVLGASPALGRLLDGADDLPGAAAAAVISHAYWRSAYGGDPGVIGQTLVYNGTAFTIQGVTEPAFDLPRDTEVWATLRGSFPDWTSGEPPGIELDLVARVVPGRDPAEVFTATEGFLQELGADTGARNELEVTGDTLETWLFGAVAPSLRVAFLAGLGLLLVAVANAALLFLASGASMVRDAALRRALGAGSRRVMAPLFADAVLQSVLGVGAGIALARLLLAALVPSAPPDLARVQEVTLNLPTVGFAAGLGVVSLLLAAGVTSAWLSGRTRCSALLGASRTRATHGESLRRGIAAGQVALAVVTAVGATLLWQSVRNLESLDRGFEADGLYVVNLHLPFSPFEPPDGFKTALLEVSDLLGSTPGVEAASPTINAPLLQRGGIDFAPGLEGQTEEEAASNPFIGFDAVLPRYFQVARTDVVRGRAFGPDDGPDDPPSIIVNVAAARALWPGLEALGQRVYMGGLSRQEWRTVVGVVEDHRFRSFPEAHPAAYVPLAQYDRLVPARLLVRSDGTASLRLAVEDAFAASFGDVRVLSVERMSEVMRQPLMRPRFVAGVLGAFAFVTLLLTAVGVYGVFSVMVQERTQELGIRRALGAASGHLAWFVATRVLLVGVVGAGLGVVASLWATELLESLVFGVSTSDPRTIGVVALVAVGLGLLAGTLPAVRAVRADPALALRVD